jgi:hypothetical protein
MAEVWFAREGKDATTGEAAYQRPLRELERLLGLRPRHFHCPLDDSPTFKEETPGLAEAGYKHVVVKLGEEEAKDASWLPGFYELPLNPTETMKLLGPRDNAKNSMRHKRDMKRKSRI